MININSDYDDLGQYNNAIRIQGDAQQVLEKLIGLLKAAGKKKNPAFSKESRVFSCYSRKTSYFVRLFTVCLMLLRFRCPFRSLHRP